jgi:hypothetical protein
MVGSFGRLCAIDTVCRVTGRVRRRSVGAMRSGVRPLMMLAMASLLLAACGAAAPAAGPIAAGNKLAAQRDVQKLLGLVVLPPGAARVSAEPTGDGGLMRRPPSEPGTPNLIERHGFWRVSAPLDQVMAFVKTHRPVGSGWSGKGRMGGPGMPDNEELTFSFRPIRGVISTRWLSFTVVVLGDGSTGVRVDAQDVWIVARSASERVPAGVREIDIRSAYPGQAPIVSRRVIDPAKVRQIIRWIDALGTVQPEAYACPVLGGPTVTLDFRATSGALLAGASMMDSQGPSGPCNPIELSIRGHRQTPLIGGNFLEQVERLLGIRVNQGGRSSAVASPEEIRGFLAEAKRGTEGTFTLTYDVTIRYGHGVIRHIVVSAAQRSSGLLFYRSTPSLEISRPGGPAASYSYEVFSRPGSNRVPGSGLYSCRRALPSSRWSCQGPYTGIGMGGTGELLGPYPPQALVLGLENATVAYTGVPAPPALRPEAAFLTTRRASGRELRCLEFGRMPRLLGRVCLEPSGVIASYHLPEPVTYGPYEAATLRAYSPHVRRDAFKLPAKPKRA